jgi:hypothetical protein
VERIQLELDGVADGAEAHGIAQVAPRITSSSPPHMKHFPYGTANPVVSLKQLLQRQV